MTYPRWYGGAGTGESLNVKDFGAVGNNTAIDTPAIAAAIAAAVAAGGGTVYFPAGIYKTTTALNLASHLTLCGAGGQASRINNTASDMFTSGAGGVLHLAVTDLYLSASAGHIFAPGTGGIYQSVFERLVLWVSNTGKSIYKSNIGVGANTYIDNLVQSCDIIGSTSHTVPLFEFVSDGGNANRNVFSNLRVTGTGNYAFYFEEVAASGYTYDNVFRDINWENCVGGCIKAMTANSFLIEGCAVYDLSVATTKDLYYFGKSSTGLSSRIIALKRANRRGGTLGGGLVDVRLENVHASSVLFEQVGTPSGGLTIDVGGNSNVKFVGCHGSTVVQNPATGFSSGNTVADTPLAGVVCDVAGLGTPEGAITAPVGSRYARTDGGAGTSFYVKETGTGNTGWAAK